MKDNIKAYHQNEIREKLQNYCAYQERCHYEVITKLYNLKVPTNQHEQLIVHLIENNYLNEERFAKSFTRGKHRISGWGKKRIVNELKLRKITSGLIKLALDELDDELYNQTFDRLCTRRWENSTEQDIQERKQKLIAFLFRKGYEYEFILERINILKLII